MGELEELHGCSPASRVTPGSPLGDFSEGQDRIVSPQPRPPWIWDDPVARLTPL